MPTVEVQLRRVSVISSRPFEEIVRRLTATIGRPDPNASTTRLPQQQPLPISKKWFMARSDPQI